MRRRALLVGVGEDADVIEANLLDEPFELGEVLGRLAREADDEGRAKRDAWNSRAKAGSTGSCRRDK